MTTHRLPTYFISHCGGPWPYMADLRKKLQVLEQSLVVYHEENLFGGVTASSFRFGEASPPRAP